MSTVTVTMSLDDFNRLKEKADLLDNGLLDQLSKSKYYSYEWFRSFVVVKDDELINQLTETIKKYENRLNENRAEIKKVEEKYGKPFWVLLGK